MSATLRLSASFKNLIGAIKDEFEIQSGSSVSSVLLSIGIKPEVVALVSVNGEMQSKEYLIQDGDIIKVLAVVGGG